VCSSAIQQIESAQRKFTRRLSDVASLAHAHRRERHCLMNFELRRVRYDVIFMYKILFRLVDVNASDFFTLVTAESSSNTADMYIDANPIIASQFASALLL
jgi:hypothetical protein